MSWFASDLPMINDNPAFVIPPGGCQHTGMSLRDYFASQAIGHLIIAANGHAVNRDDIAAEAYKQADAMLAYRIYPKEVKVTVTDEMVNRFLCWRLPATFSPDGGVTFDKKDRDPNSHWWPVGTNILNAEEARAMLNHVLANK